MQMGILLPTFRAWFDSAALVRVCAKAEELGISSLWLGDHVVAPTAGAADRLRGDQDRPPPWAPPRDTAGLAGRPAADAFGDRFLDIYIAWMHVLDHTHLRVGSDVVVAPYRNPIVQAKMLATLDELSNGRVIVGLGAGHVPAEFDVLGVAYAERGPIMDEWVAVIKTVLSCQDVEAEYHGRYFDFRGVRTLLKTVQKPHPPLLIGGSSKAAIRRAVRFGDGWHPGDLTPGSLRAALAFVDAEMLRQGRIGRLPVSMNLGVRIVPAALSEPAPGRPRLSPDQLAALCREYASLGVEHIVAYLPTPSLDVYLAQMELLGRGVIPALKELPVILPGATVAGA